MSKEQLNQWKSHPVSKALFNTLKEHREAHNLALLNMGPFSEANIASANQLKAQINTIDQILSIDNFLEGVDLNETQF